METDDVLMSAYGLACSAVCEVMDYSGSTGVDIVFLSAGKQRREIVAVRQFTAWALRVCFGCTYGEIARKTGVSWRNVVRSVVRVKFLSSIDPEYGRISELISKRSFADGG